MPGLASCSHCGLVQTVPPVGAGWEAACSRCEASLADPEATPRDLTPTFATALSALILFPLAVTLPIMELERFGHRNEASVWSGSVGLLSEGELVVGLVVLLCSVVLPVAKLVSLLLITGFGDRIAHQQRARTWRFVELTGRWGMLDVLLIALLVAWLKLGDLVEVSPGPGALAFTVCVLASLVASALFDPRALWSAGTVPEEETS
jgi:paraquat-inducible protein A